MKKATSYERPETEKFGVLSDAVPKKCRLYSMVDLFAGCGGLSSGFENAGFTPVFVNEIDINARATYLRNRHHEIGGIAFAENPDLHSSDAKELQGKRLDKLISDLSSLPAVALSFDKGASAASGAGSTLDVIAGGPPCQGFSMAGNRIVDDPRNSLYKELLEIVINLDPEFVVCENVVGLRSMLEGKVEEKIIEDFKKAGYIMNVTVLRAADYAVPQKRDRVIFIGNKINKVNYHPKPFLTPAEYVTTGEAIGDLMKLKPSEEFNHIPAKHRPDMIKRMLELEEGKSLYKGYSDAFKKCPWDEASCTIKENHGGVNVHPKLGRVLTAREMARIQSFPDDFIFEGPKNKQLVQLGNAVPPLLAKAIGLAIRKSYGELK